jgi:two-component system KDP operon response regulator KdpE
MMSERPVLVVEDDPAMRQSIRWTLEAEGIPVVDAATAAQAIAAAVGGPLALLLLDYGLPDGDGAGVASAVRERLAEAVPPIVVLTADGRAAEKAARVGAVAYLHKPFELDDLLATVRRALGG